MKIQVLDNPTGRQWTLVLSELEIACVYGCLMEHICKKTGIPPKLLQSIFLVTTAEEQKEVFNIISKISTSGELASAIACELSRLGPSSVKSDLTSILGEPKE